MCAFPTEMIPVSRTKMVKTPSHRKGAANVEPQVSPPSASNVVRSNVHGMTFDGEIESLEDEALYPGLTGRRWRMGKETGAVLWERTHVGLGKAGLAAVRDASRANILTAVGPDDGDKTPVDSDQGRPFPPRLFIQQLFFPNSARVIKASLLSPRRPSPQGPTTTSSAPIPLLL